ncbi:MAG TPA: RNA polymerase factor sigma-54 [Gemmatimonadaceae bacterium]|nr:RNA polymerase factor sigma-54 [Gemmatimonadaceae bacterium]
MKTGLQQSTGLRQELKINPRLYQAMDLLYMPLLDLQQHLKQELLTNPFLDLVEPEDDENDEADEAEETGDTDASETLAADEVSAKEEQGQDSDSPIDWEEILLDGFATGGAPAEHEVREQYEPVIVARADLTDHLMEQLSLLDLTPRQEPLAAEFVGNINEDGYLACSMEEVVESLNEAIRGAAEHAGEELAGLPLYTTAEGEEVLAIVQRLDPAGVGARDLRECLLLQLRDQGREDTLAGRLVRDEFEELTAHRWPEIARRTGLSAQEVQAAADEIQKLDPKPGLRFSATEEDYIIPDLIVEKVDGKYRVTLNDGNLPRLRLSRTYQDIARDKSKFQGENRDFISSKLNAATWMIQAIEQRRQTMLKVMNYIVDRQRPFLEKGVEQLKPLTLREVADAIGMHESTVSRVTNEKWVQTPRGVLPLKFFFSAGLTTADGDDVSARGIRAQIEKLIREEDATHPLTDQEIVEVFNRQGVKIARRTVAKYRDQLGVLSARMRKRI